jgi:hypothetical protein
MCFEERVSGVAICIASILILYLYLKLTGQVPGPGWWIWNGIDYLMMKLFKILLFVIPSALIVYFCDWYIKKIIRKRTQQILGKIKAHQEDIKYLLEQKENSIVSKVKSIESDYKKIAHEINDLKEESAKLKLRGSESEQAALENFV